MNFVIDADGIAALKDNLSLFKKRENKIILTPHFGEFANLIDIDSEELKSNFYNYAKVHVFTNGFQLLQFQLLPADN